MKKSYYFLVFAMLCAIVSISSCTNKTEVVSPPPPSNEAEQNTEVFEYANNDSDEETKIFLEFPDEPIEVSAIEYKLIDYSHMEQDIRDVFNGKEVEPIEESDLCACIPTCTVSAGDVNLHVHPDGEVIYYKNHNLVGHFFISGKDRECISSLFDFSK